MTHYTSANERDVHNIAAIYLDGVKQKGVVEVDDTKGFVRKLKRDSKGNYVTKGDELVCETLKGNVRVELKPEAERV